MPLHALSDFRNIYAAEVSNLVAGNEAELIEGDHNIVEPSSDETVDPRLVFLERASARLLLINAGDLDLGAAFDGLVGSLCCPCTRETVERCERNAPPLKRWPARRTA